VPVRSAARLIRGRGLVEQDAELFGQQRSQQGVAAGVEMVVLGPVQRLAAAQGVLSEYVVRIDEGNTRRRQHRSQVVADRVLPFRVRRAAQRRPGVGENR